MASRVIKIEVNDKQAVPSLEKQIKTLKKLNRDIFPRVIGDSLSEVARDASSKVRQRASPKLRLSRSLLKKRVRHRSADKKGMIRFGRLSAAVLLNLKKIPMISLNEGRDPKQGFSSGRRPVTALNGLAIGRGINQRFLRRAFIQRVKGKPHVLQRVGKERYPITFPTIEVEKEFTDITRGTVPFIQKTKFPRIFRRQLARRIKEIERKSKAN